MPQNYLMPQKITGFLFFDFKLKIALLILLFFCLHKVKAQDFKAFTEPAISVDLTTEGPMTYTFTAINRSRLYTDNQFTFKEKFFELEAVAGYDISKKHNIGLGFKYRFNKLFEKTGTDEKRLIEQYKYKGKIGTLPFDLRIRLEQRFSKVTRFRQRAKFGVKFPLNQAQNPLWLKPATELGYTLSPEAKPFMEQRAGVFLERKLSDKTSWQAGVQYRIEDFLQKSEHRLFLLIQLDIEI